MFDFDVLVISVSKSVRTCPTVLLYPENVGVAVEISLLSHIQAEI